MRCLDGGGRACGVQCGFFKKNIRIINMRSAFPGDVIITSINRLKETDKRELKSILFLPEMFSNIQDLLY